MASSYLLCTALYGLIAIVSCQKMTESEVCASWKMFGQSMSTSSQRSWDGPGIHTNCKIHKEKCERLDCGGVAHVNILTDIKFSFCFGIEMFHCDRPPYMQVVVQIPELGTNINRQVSHNDSFDVPGLSKKANGGTLTVVLFVEFVKIGDNHFKFGLKAKVRFTITAFDEEITSWPKDLQKTIIPPVRIPVTHCNHTTHNTLITPPTCVPTNYMKGATTRNPIHHMTVPPQSTTYFKQCNFGDMGPSKCSRNEICRMSQHKSKYPATCQCAPDFKMSKKTGFCESIDGSVPLIPFTPIIDPAPVVTVPPKHAPHGTDNNESNNGGSSIKNNKPLIIGCVVGGVVVLGIIVVVIVVVMKKRGAQYSGRQLLLTEEDTDGVI